MIAEHYDKGFVGNPEALYRVDDAADLFVGPSDGCVIEVRELGPARQIVRFCRHERPRRIDPPVMPHRRQVIRCLAPPFPAPARHVGQMRIHELRPQQQRLAGIAVCDLVDHLVGDRFRIDVLLEPVLAHDGERRIERSDEAVGRAHPGFRDQLAGVAAIIPFAP